MRPVGRRDAGLYTCQAQNSVGTSEQLSVQLDVKCECASLYLSRSAMLMLFLHLLGQLCLNFLLTSAIFLSLSLFIVYLAIDSPKIISAGPDRLTTAPLFSPAAFECVADGNPMPSYKWVQR